MTVDDDAYRAQAAVFCSDLHRHIELLDGYASSEARKLRIQATLADGMKNQKAISVLQDQLKSLAAERQRLMEMLAAMGHAYPCGHGEPDEKADDDAT